MDQLKDKVGRRLTSARAWELPKQTSAVAPKDVWTNHDMDPTPPEEQTWSIWVIMAYWMTDTVNLATWQVASGILSLGLSWREAIPCMVVGTVCVAVPMVLNGAIGSTLHIPFAVITAASFGYYLRYFCVVSRAVLAMFWFGIQSANGAQCVTIMLRALAPGYNDIPNVLPADAGIDSKGLCSYFIFWVVQLPLLLIHPTKLRPIFWIKLFSAPAAAIATMGWSIRQAGGAGDIFALKAEATGNSYTLLWLTGMTTITGSWATMACNIPDFTRYARSRRGQFVQMPFLPIIFTLCGVLGIVTTSASKVFTGTYVWNPLDIIAMWLDLGSGGRCAAFFAALAWYIAQVGTNITTNSISAANDLTVMFPRWINIKRGSVIVALVGGWAFVPWKILGSATTFLSFMGGYAVFLAPISGIMVADYWLVNRRRYDIPALYDPNGRYRFVGGCNWRASVAFLVPVAPLLPGLALSISGPSAVSVSQGAQNLYSVNWLFGFILSILLYTALSLMLPAKGGPGSIHLSLPMTYNDEGAVDTERRGSRGEKGCS
ncbi:purine-cytosine permease family protein [Hirsutella rhossiliensis]|uniref:Permease for cytosine/purines, uracil, thiamine, allantoin n=1 Tax=Hirsutella rhossiliensis TaxID=111463 RepID=A0A9P8N2R0_9HYPO|nr:permease for cytosine/purines, uracil, thiamine, allantoin [Hirsutella rhossiliensis]KAH0966583.1 permease for cytosine/purines, uracil, thiamine, allantoin [Hirsutella rhossiliensis]